MLVSLAVPRLVEERLAFSGASPEHRITGLADPTSPVGADGVKVLGDEKRRRYKTPRHVRADCTKSRLLFTSTNLSLIRRMQQMRSSRAVSAILWSKHQSLRPSQTAVSIYNIQHCAFGVRRDGGPPRNVIARTYAQRRFPICPEEIGLNGCT